MPSSMFKSTWPFHRQPQDAIPLHGHLSVKSLPVNASMALRLHEIGSEEDQARLVYVLCVCLSDKERWLSQSFKKPQDLQRWALSGVDSWGLASEFEPIRRLARSQEWERMVSTSQGRLNEILYNNISHLVSLFYSAPGIDHLYWIMIQLFFGGVLWQMIGFSSWLGLQKGPLTQYFMWVGLFFILYSSLKVANYIWQDSSNHMAEGIRNWIWGRSPRDHAQQLMAWQTSDTQPTQPHFDQTIDHLLTKAKNGTLKPLEALELSQYQKKNHLLKEDWINAQNKMKENGRTLIEQSQQKGWVLAQFEQAQLKTLLSLPPDKKPPIPQHVKRL